MPGEEPLPKVDGTQGLIVVEARQEGSLGLAFELGEVACAHCRLPNEISHELDERFEVTSKRGGADPSRSHGGVDRHSGAEAC